MNRSISTSFLILFFLGCKNSIEKPDNTTTDSKEFVMYQMSEMAALMEQMYVENQHLKERIKKGDTLGKFPVDFLKIHNSVMTDENDNDAFFKTQSTIFISAQELIYKDPVNAKQHFNTAIASCISCHEKKCTGPISRIKKLYIE